MRFAFTVAEAFSIRTRGLVLASGPQCEPGAHLYIGSGIELRRPDGTVRKSKVCGIEMATPNPDRIFAILVSLEVTRDDVPTGTQVWTDEVKP